MERTEHRLYVFGYGISLLIPFLVYMHSIKPNLGLGMFCLVLLGGFAGVMFVITKAADLKPKINAWMFIPILWMIGHGITHGVGLLLVFFWLVSILSLAASILNVNLLIPVYDKWMVVAHFIGLTITTIVLTLFYYVVFGISGIVLRLLNKDLLEEKLDKEAKSYWVKRNEEDFDHKHFENQY